jgi:diaminopimelate epimerase
MTSPIHFTKMHGIGNDYIYINAHTQRIDDPANLAVAMSDRHFGIGADGIILICRPSAGVRADVRMRMFNADGSESEMCGNGVRCVCKYAHDRGLAKANPMKIETGRGVLSLEYALDREKKIDQVTVDMGEPILETARIPVKLQGETARVVDVPIDGLFAWPARLPEEWMRACGLVGTMTCVSMGNPHAMLFCRSVSKVPLEEVGPAIESAAVFPRKTNAHFVQVDSPREITMRTWERGTGITLACGTGASAVCVAGVLARRTEREILAHLPGGDLRLRWDEQSNHVFMTGPATEVFDGSWSRQTTPPRSAAPAR